MSKIIHFVYYFVDHFVDTKKVGEVYPLGEKLHNLASTNWSAIVNMVSTNWSINSQLFTSMANNFGHLVCWLLSPTLLTIADQFVDIYQQIDQQSLLLV